MNKKQYNNVIENTLKHEQTDDSLSTARAIFDNMGVALPQGDMKTVYETIKTDNYMGWKSCTMQEAQEAANNGTAAIGISEDKIVVLSANDQEQPVAQTALVMTLDENTSAYAVAGLEYYLYSYGTTNGTTQLMTPATYHNRIMNTPLIYRNGNTTYCNIWAQNVLQNCGVPYPQGGCTSMLSQFREGFSDWLPLSNSQFQQAQAKANEGFATIAITGGHIAVVTPNNIDAGGTTPTVIGQVLVSQSGWDCFYKKTLSYAWAAADRGEIEFYYYNG